jgi:tetratricopeptide (TPR) repeat protein
MFRSTFEDYDRSIQCFKRALEMEPNSAIAHSYLCVTEVSRVHFMPDPELLERAHKEAREALRLEPDLPEAHRALAGVLVHQDNFADALEEQLRAIESGGPEERAAAFIGTTLITLGRPDRALGWLELAKHSASLPGDYDALIGDCWTLLGEDQRAENAYRQSMDLRPEITEGWVGLSHLRLLQGDINAARKMCQENQERSKRDTDVNNNWAKLSAQIEFFARNYREANQLYLELANKDSGHGAGFYGGISYASVLGRLRQELGDESASRTLLKQCLQKELAGRRSSQNPDTLYRISAVYSSLGEKELALEYLSSAARAGWIDHRSLRLDPRFDQIMNESRFKEIIATLSTKATELRRRVGQPITMASNGDRRSP